MSGLVPIEQVANELGCDCRLLRPLGGASASVFGVGDEVLRIGPRARIDVEIAAMAAAAFAVPVPQMLDRADVGSWSGVLLRRVKGRPAADLGDSTIEGAARRGAACGRLHRALAAVPAPAGVGSVSGFEGGAGTKTGLLHLDLHAKNVLVGEDDRVTAVLDWANAAVGATELDLARTMSVLTLDPAARARRSDPRWRAFVRGWLEVGLLEAGLEHGVSANATEWACVYMLNDLSARYSSAELQPVDRALRRTQARNDHL